MLRSFRLTCSPSLPGAFSPSHLFVFAEMQWATLRFLWRYPFLWYLFIVGLKWQGMFVCFCFPAGVHTVFYRKLFRHWFSAIPGVPYGIDTQTRIGIFWIWIATHPLENRFIVFRSSREPHDSTWPGLLRSNTLGLGGISHETLPQKPL